MKIQDIKKVTQQRYKMVQRRSCFCIVQISSENVHTAKSNLQIQGESHQAFDVIICRSREEIWN